MTEPANTNLKKESKRITSALAAILLGCFGTHKFLLNYSKEGRILLIVTLLGFLLFQVYVGIFILMAVFIFCVAEGIIYLLKSDRQFIDTYQKNHRSWL
ncbi:hypothetical protein QQ020_28170 [Fulvivirgaceae bacterium BMA12]|uniref:TM2 domain-containing protein n=1 Tax=Agaribacillus aureus TaxID=3051825 RepID=A0ABT8LGD0_9BACT|nr:hypothetical protein [Fulvivirgaceae bacterium BMA12]